jgi:O-antigen chain-terminating methyltransferase
MIKHRQESYLPYFEQCTNVIDLGCGRGEFLELLREQQIPAYGVDQNQVMVEYCRQKELRVESAEVLNHLQTLPDESLDGIFTAQMVEHYSLSQIQDLLRWCFAKLQPHKYLIIETQNPQSFYAFANFYRDISHDKPIHPDALHYLLKTAGFQDIRREDKTPYPPSKTLQELDVPSEAKHPLRPQIARLNQNIRQLNDIIYGYLDYALIARKTQIF